MEKYKDLLERVGFTFAEAFIASITVAPLIDLDASTLQLAIIAGASAALVVVKEFVKNNMPSK
jgi:hypothetical protein